MIDWILGFEFNGALAVALYWAPFALCVYGYTIRTWNNYQKDVTSRETETYYRPTDTVGDLIGRGIVSAIPVANLFAATFDVAPKVFGDFFSWLGRVFNAPIVPKKPV